jgi:hypothetical protein
LAHMRTNGARGTEGRRNERGGGDFRIGVILTYNQDTLHQLWLTLYTDRDHALKRQMGLTQTARPHVGQLS